MLAKVNSGAVLGVDAYVVRVEVDTGNGVPHFAVVGLGDAAVQESRERVKSAVRNSGYAFPPMRIVVNLAPADIRKGGPGYDLPIALGFLAATEQLLLDNLEHYLLVGELSLDGSVRSTSGILAIAMEAKRAGFKGMVVPACNASEAALVEGLAVYGVETLSQAVGVLNDPGAFPTTTINREQLFAGVDPNLPDFSDIKGQEHAKRALTIAAAGSHNILLVGPPGSGKTMLAKRIPSIMPPMELAESLEVTKLYSVTGLLPQGTPLVTVRPFRSPHHSVSAVGLVGGSSIPRPGEISLAHQGVLFLDEFPEFPREAVEVLRQPLEDGVVTISRAQISLTFPAQFTLAVALNPCPCGYKGDSIKPCTCSPNQAERYWSRLSGPLLDRIDLQIEVPRLSQSELMTTTPSESSFQMRERVLKAREIQSQRFKKLKGMHSNARMHARQIREYCKLDVTGQELLRQAIARLGLSARSYDRILKVSRTIADLEGSEMIQPHHLAEAIQYRNLDRGKA